MMFYSIIAAIIDEKKKFLELFQRMFATLKNVPADELQKKLINKLSEVIHEENKK